MLSMRLKIVYRKTVYSIPVDISIVLNNSVVDMRIERYSRSISLKLGFSETFSIKALIFGSIRSL